VPITVSIVPMPPAARLILPPSSMRRISAVAVPITVSTWLSTASVAVVSNWVTTSVRLEPSTLLISSIDTTLPL